MKAEEHKSYKLACQSNYFKTKYGDNPIIIVEKEMDFHYCNNPAGFLFIGRALAEGRMELFKGTHYYGHVAGLGELVHESEIGEEVK